MRKSIKEQIVSQGLVNLKLNVTDVMHAQRINKKGNFIVNKSSSKKLNTREIEELMGVHRTTYKRVRGVIRSK